jgi:putative transposase
MKDPKYDSLSHAKFKLRYHIIFSTKYRKGLLRNKIGNKIKSYMLKCCTKDWNIEIMEIDPKMPNHIHLLIKSTPYVSITEIIHKLKQTSTYYVWKENHNYMKSYYWTGQHHLWTKGYFCTTIGDACTETIWNYIKNQG